MKFSANNCTFFCRSFYLFDTDVWTHLCVSYDAQTSRLSLYKDGRATNIDHIERNVADARFRQKKENSFHDNIFFIISFPPDFLDYVFLGRCLYAEAGPGLFSTRGGVFRPEHLVKAPEPGRDGRVDFMQVRKKKNFSR